MKEKKRKDLEALAAELDKEKKKLARVDEDF